MKSTPELTGTSKRFYLKPSISRIELDNEISMVMATDPPVDPEGPGSYLPPDRFDNNPFKIYKA